MAKNQGKTAKPSTRKSNQAGQSGGRSASEPQYASQIPRTCAARKNLEDQVRAVLARRACYKINLSAMHRAAGRPPGKDPLIWMLQATDVITSIHCCKAVEDPVVRSLNPVSMIGDNGEEPETEFDQPGDIAILHVEVAMIYALHLDERLSEDIPLRIA